MSQKINSMLEHMYETDSIDNLSEILSHGALSGSGKLMILAVDQGFEHGPTRSFAAHANTFDPHYHFQLALDGGLSAFAAPLGFLEAGARTFAHKIPTILKMNSGSCLVAGGPNQAMTATVDDAIRLGCKGVGFTIYPGSSHLYDMIEKIRDSIRQAKQKGLVVVIWSYPRGNMSKAGETGLDIVSYGAHMACLLGAHIVKVKIPTAHIERVEERQALAESGIEYQTLTDRIRYIKKSCFDGRRLVIFSGGDKKNDGDLLEEVQAIQEGQGNGSIIGRNLFQRPRQDSLKLINKIIQIYKGHGS